MTPREDRLAGIDWRVCVILDPRFLPAGRTLFDVAWAAIRGGAGLLQLRDKTSTAREVVQAATRLVEICTAEGAAFIVNDRLDIALAVGADGVHLGSEDVPVDLARRVAPELVIGGSARTVRRAKVLREQGADYLGCGAVYDAHPVKPNASDAQGPQLIQAVTDEVDIPVLGIGGISAETADEVRAAGAVGVAVIRAVVAADDPEAATRALLG